MKQIVMGLTLAAMLTMPAVAQHNHGSHGGGTHGNAPTGMKEKTGATHGQAAVPSDAASQAFAAANAKMHRDMAIKFTGNADSDFVRGMIPHHQGAVDVAQIVLKFGKDEEVKKLATQIIAAQKTEIDQMQAWLQKNANTPAGSKAKEVIAAYEDINAAMHKDMDIDLTGKPDVDFMAGMIPHHEGAVEMAKVLLRYGNDTELRKLAEDVVRSQSAEIVMMIGWLRRNGG
jgi:uncharacterized protein (DUF305 family)